MISCKVYFSDEDNNDYVNDNDNDNDNDDDNDNNINNNNKFRLARSLLDPSQCYYTETYSIFVGDSLLTLFFSRERETRERKEQVSPRASQ